MSFRNSLSHLNNPPIPPPPPTRTTTMSSLHNTNDDHKPPSENKDQTKNQWVEIVEPRSKTKIYANLDSGICAKIPPHGVSVSKYDDFSDHWWELYDKKTGKFYYYNPEQQKTAWIKPEEPSSHENNYTNETNTICNNNNIDIDSNNKRKRLLIIPVSKLQTFKEIIPGQNDRFDITTVKCDASTQTNSKVTVSIATQTSDRDDACDKLESFKPTAGHGTKRRELGIFKAQMSLDSSISRNYRDDFQHIENGLRSIDFDDEDDDNDDNDDIDDDDECELNNEIIVGGKLREDFGIGWKSNKNHDSPDSSTQKSLLSLNISNKSPTHPDTSPNSNFILKNLINDETDPSTCKSQQLDHRKLVENFKKSRQTSLLGTHNDISKLYTNRYGINNGTGHMLKNVAENYFNNHHNDGKGLPIGSDKHLRQLSTLSTLPRPRKDTKDRIALSKPETTGPSLIMDADYDVVEENCGYYSDSEHNTQNNQFKYKSGPRSPNNNNNNTNQADNVNNQLKNSNFERNTSTRGSTFSVESFARENLSKHAKKGTGIFNRKVKLSKMISWTKSGIKHPMISSVSSDLSTESLSCFKLIQQYMGDREIVMSRRYREIAQNTPINLDDINCSNSILDTSTKSSISSLASRQDKSLLRSTSTSSNITKNSNHSHQSTPNNFSLDRLRDELAFDIVTKGCAKAGLRDEIYIQLARQLTENPSEESIRLGLTLMSILLSYFSPSTKFSPYIVSFLESHSHSLARDVCLVRLNRRLNQNYPTYCRKPADGNEISIVRLSITKWPQYCGVFGESLQRIMSMQTCSPYLSKLRLPWILTTLGKKLLETDGPTTEGIFRCAADHDLIAQLRLEIDCVDFRKITDSKQVDSLLSNVQDPHVIAGLLKLFFRQLTDSVFPTHLYELCLQNSQDGHKACRIFNDHLSNLNKDVAAYLIRLLQYLSKPDQVHHTKMDNSNLSMVWAPNLLRAANRDESIGDSKWSISNWIGNENDSAANHLGHSQSSIFEQTRQEMQFIRSLITHLDTSFIDNIV